MNSHTEDVMYEIHTAVTENKLWDAFNAQLKKMRAQNKHKYKTSSERWEYAFNKVKRNNGLCS